MASYTSDQDWTDEAEAEQAAVSRRSGAPALGLPIVTALLGLLVGVLGTSLWWSWSATPASRAEAPTSAAAAPASLAPKVASAAPAASPVLVAPPSPVVATAAAPSDDVAAMLSPPAAGPAASATASGLSAEEVARRRERAWARFYKRPNTCEGNPTGDQLVECGNHYIRMRREFDERWRAGSL